MSHAGRSGAPGRSEIQRFRCGVHLLDVMFFEKPLEVRNPRRWFTGIAVAGAAAVAMRRR